MNNSGMLVMSALSAVLLLAGCDRQETPVKTAVENTKDALDMREHEKLKDAVEDTQDAVDNAVEGIKDETRSKQRHSLQRRASRWFSPGSPPVACEDPLI